jgi:hypothetical protein
MTTAVKLRAAVLGVGLWLVSALAVAQSAPPNAGGAAQAEGSAPAAGGAAGQEAVEATSRMEGGRRVYSASTTIEVRGDIQRPFAFTLSGRSSLGYSYLDVPVRFIQEIMNAVRRAPF